MNALTPTRDWILPELTPEPDNSVLMHQIVMEVAHQCGLNAHDLTGPRRDRHLFRPRALAMKICREHTKASLQEIGYVFGNRDHTSIIHALRQFDTWATPLLHEKVIEIAHKVGASEAT